MVWCGTFSDSENFNVSSICQGRCLCLEEKLNSMYYNSGILFCVIQMLSSDLLSLINFSFAVLLVICFVICQYMYYTLMPWVITLSSATVVNLSLLTSDLYTLMFGLFLFGYKVRQRSLS